MNNKPLISELDELKELGNNFNSLEPHKKAFLEKYAEIGVINETARAIGVSEAIIYVWRKQEPFKKLFELASEAFTQKLELELYKRALGYTQAKMSDVLLMFALKARRPDLYREKIPELKLPGEITIKLALPDRVYPKELIEASSEASQAIQEGAKEEGGSN